jgi:hypothetical protein
MKFFHIILRRKAQTIQSITIQLLNSIRDQK